MFEDATAESCQQREAARTALEGTQFVAVPIEQLASMYERFMRLAHMGTAEVQAWQAMNPEVKDLRHAIFKQADFGALFAGQWLPREVRKATYDRVKEDLRNSTPSQ